MGRTIPTYGLVLAGNVTIGNQVASLLRHNGWWTHVVYSDREAYQAIHQRNVDVIITDIESQNIGGLAVMIWCKNYHPSIIPYAICKKGQRDIMQLARDFGGCAGYFYLKDQRPMEVDVSQGMAARFVDSQVEEITFQSTG